MTSAHFAVRVMFALIAVLSKSNAVSEPSANQPRKMKPSAVGAGSGTVAYAPEFTVSVVVVSVAFSFTKVTVKVSTGVAPDTT